jgi:hypothetical protein
MVIFKGFPSEDWFTLYDTLPNYAAHTLQSVTQIVQLNGKIES